MKFFKKTKTHYLIILLLAIIITLPATLPLFNKAFFHMHDFTHVARLSEMTRAIEDGHFPVRWSKNFGFGYGMPLYNFYGPLPFYLAFIIHTIGFSALFSIKAIIYLNFITSFMAMYYLSKYFWGKYGGVVAATAVIYAPYRAVNAYVRGSISELTGITFVIISLFTITQVVRKKKAKWVLFSSLSLAGIVLSHNITALIAFPAILLFALSLASNTKPPFLYKKISRISTSFLLSIGLSAFYTLPAFLEKSHTAIANITSGYFHYSQHFLYLRQLINSPWGYGGSIYGLEDGISFEIGKLHIILALFGGLGLLLASKKKKYTKAAIMSSSVIIVISIFMTTFKTQFIWDNIILLQFVQFPWRFLSIITVFSSLLAGGSIAMLRSRNHKKLLITCGIVLLFVFLNTQYFRPKEYLDNNDALYYEDESRIQSRMSETLPDYMPPGVENPQSPPSSRFEILQNEEIRKIDPIIDRTQEFLFETQIDGKSQVQINIFDFPGWKIFIDDQEVEYGVSEDLPIITLDLDPQVLQTNKVRISGIFTETPIRKIGNAISFSSILLIIYLWLNERHSRSKR